jgi:hypothetical protein
MSKAKTVKEVLVAAKWILENIGWHQGSFYKDKKDNRMIYPIDITSPDVLSTLGSFCAVGAINVVEKADYNPDTETSALQQKTFDTLVEFLPFSVRNIPYWNDAIGRTKQEVLAVFDKAIEVASNENI